MGLDPALVLHKTPEPRPTRYRVVVLTSSRRVEANGHNKKFKLISIEGFVRVTKKHLLFYLDVRIQ